MIVVDASAAVLGLLGDGDAREALASQALAAPHVIDVEVAHALRGQLRRGVVGDGAAERALTVWGRLGIRRFGVVALLPRVWALRDNLSAYDASYVALAEVLECQLLTADARLAGAPGPTCPVAVVRA